MIRKAESISSRPKSEPYYEITASLLNSWQRIWDAPKSVKESEGDTMSLEDKEDQARSKAYAEFVDVLSRKPIPDNEAMRKGREYEDLVCRGEDDVFSPIIENGEFQAAYLKKERIKDTNIVLYGILDCLKAGRIMDIKRVGTYKSGKYKTSHQHPMYLYLVPEARDFTYLVMDDKGHRHFERYERCNCEDLLSTVRTFLEWLESNNLMTVFKQNWDWSRKKHK